MLLDVRVVFVVVARDQQRPRLAAAAADVGIGKRADAALPPAPGRVRWRDGGQREAVNVMHHRTFDLQCVVLLGAGAEVTQVIGGEVDAADEGDFPVDHHDLAMQAAEQVDPLAQQPLAWIEHLDADADIGHRRHEFGGEVGRAITIHGDIHGRTALRRSDQRLLQFDADLVFEEDEGLEQDFLLGLSNGLEHTRKEFLSVFQQLKTISVSPVKLHRCNSTASGR